MLNAEWFRDKKITVMGLGLHGGGVGVAKWLMRRGARVTVTDMKDAAALKSSVEELEKAWTKATAEATAAGRPLPHPFTYVLGRHNETDFTEADTVIQNPAVPRDNPFLSLARSRGVSVETDISIFFQLCPFPIAAVTGTKGKTTTTTLLSEICRRHDKRTVVGGNIRISPLDALDKLLELAARKKPAPPIVLELSSWQLEGLERHRLSPHVGVITNIMEDHLNRYRDMDDYARAKGLIVAFQGRDDVAVLNADDERVAGIGRELLEKMGTEETPRVVWFSAKPVREGDGCFLSAGKIVMVFRGERQALFPRSAIKIAGSHNVANVLSASAAAVALGIPAKTIAAGVRAFRGVPGRLEDLGSKKGVHYINDTTATTPDACIAALRTVGRGRNVVLLAGGADKELRFEDWALEVGKRVKFLTLFEGTATSKMEAALDAAGVKTPRLVVKSMKEALSAARGQAKRGDVVLLSPACASFGLFVNEFDRGDQFTAGVRRME